MDDSVGSARLPFGALALAVDVPLAPAPFGEEQPIEGDLSPRAATLASREAGAPLTVGVFACNPGSLIGRRTLDETIYILEGEVEIALDNGDSIVLRQGDVGVIGAGHVATWTFRAPFKELYVLRN